MISSCGASTLYAPKHLSIISFRCLPHVPKTRGLPKDGPADLTSFSRGARRDGGPNDQLEIPTSSRRRHRRLLESTSSGPASCGTCLDPARFLQRLQRRGLRLVDYCIPLGCDRRSDVCKFFRIIPTKACTVSVLRRESISWTNHFC